MLWDEGNAQDFLVKPLNFTNKEQRDSGILNRRRLATSLADDRV